MPNVKISNLLFLFLLSVRGDGHIEMSTNDLRVPLAIHKSISNELKNFMSQVAIGSSFNSQQEDLKYFQSYITNFQELTKNIQEEGFRDPIHAYLLLRHMTVDYEEIANHVKSPKAKDLLNNITDNYMKSKYPTGKDMESAAISLIRLQSVYNLSIESLITKDYRILMTASDCFRLGSQAVLTMNLKLAHQWFGEGLKLLNSSPVENNVSDETKNAVTSQYEAIDNILSYGNIFEDLLSGAVRSAPSYLLDMANFIPGLPNNFFQKIKANVPSEGHKEYSEEYKQLCQGKTLMDSKSSKDLLCAYVRGSHPRFLLSPNKIEMLSFDPVVAVYHDILTEKQMDYLKSVSKQKLEVARTKSYSNGDHVVNDKVTNARTGKMTFLNEEKDIYLQDLSLRINHITGLNMDYAENWQVVNYGIGGHYEVHCDYYSFLERNISFPGGDRLATMLFYLNDVRAGGHTVFPVLGISVQPKKGSALFWYNLKKNGDGNLQTIHAACPVLSGTKWISNKWIHAHGNELVTPCSIDSDE